MKKNTAHWVELARYDWRVVHHMYKSRSYPYVIFMCHLTIEKLFKACISEFTDMIPPKIHDLNKLAEKGQVTIPDEYASFISKLSQQSVATRYPEDLKDYNRQDAQYYMPETEKVMLWLEQTLKSTE